MTTTTKYTPEETAANRKKWTAELRSGNRKQGKGQLRGMVAEGEEFCCLGVACEVAVEEGVTARQDNGYEDAEIGYAQNSLLPVSVRDWLGLAGEGGQLRVEVPYTETELDGVEYETSATSLAGLNDSAGYTFEQLGDLIDADGVILAGEED